MNALVAQKARAARIGNESASARKQLKLEASKHGAMPICAALHEHPVSRGLETLHIEKLLCFIPGITAPKADALLEGLPCRLTATVGDLTYRKRVLLCKALAAPPKPNLSSGRRAEASYFSNRRKAPRRVKTAEKVA